MTLNVSILLTAKGSGARAELNTTAKSVEDLRRKLRAMGVQSDRVEHELRQFATSSRTAAGAATGLGNANAMAAGKMANLTAQFNDLGIMLAAGQNPLQLALQQGTQITQVIGPLGATGAVKALGQAFLSLLSPVNLVTLAAIAGGAAFVQWLTRAGEDAETLEDRIDALSSAVDRYEAAVGRSLAGSKDLAEAFGSAQEAAREVFRVGARFELQDALEELRETASGLIETFGGLSREKLVSGSGRLLDTSGGVMREIEQTLLNIREDFGLTTEQAARLVLALERIDQAGTPEEAIAGARALQDALIEVFGTAEKVPPALREAEKAARAGAEEAARITGQQEATIRLWETGSAAFLQSATQFVQSRVAAARAAGEIVARLEDEAALQQAIARHGADSAEVARLRADRERRAVRAQIEALVPAGALRDHLIEAAEKALELSRTDISSGIATAADEARRLAEQLGIGLSRAGLIARAGALGTAGDTAGVGTPQGPAGLLPQNPNAAFPEGGVIVNPSREAPGSARAADTQARALERLIEREREQLELLRETDPVQKEMIRNREALKGATDAERAAVERLIRTRQEEEEALKRVREEQAFFENTAFDAIEGLTLRGRGLTEVFDDLADAIARAALQAVLLGDGPLAGLFGTTAGGGILGTIADAIFPAAATGGYITGPGSGTSDQVLIAASSGEMVMNARATARNRHLLEMLNAGGRLPGFARGGVVGATPERRRLPGPDSAEPVSATEIHNWYIETPDAASFAEDRAAVARGARRLTAQTWRYT